MNIEVFGPSSAKSTVLAKQCQLAAAAKGGNISVSKVANRDRLSELGTNELPALVIGGVIKSRGRIPSREEITGWINEAISSSTLH